MTQSLGLSVPSSAQNEVDRQLPAGDEIFLDHVAHFVRDPDAAQRALIRCGFAPTPVSIQVNPDPFGGTRPTGTGNITAMFERGYAEVLFKTSDTPLAREFDAMLEQHAGLHLAAFSVVAAEAAHRRLAASGFPVRELVRMSRPVDTAGADTATFTIARVEPGVMPEGRIQMLTHHSEQAVWQPRWLSHPNSATGLIDMMIAVGDVEEAAQRFSRFTGRAATPRPGGSAFIPLDRGGVYLISRERVARRLPEVAITKLPFIAAYALRVRSLAIAESTAEHADLEWRAIDGGEGIVVTFPVELGQGAWFFVERALGLPWRQF